MSDTLVEIVVESSFDGIAYTVTEVFFNTQEDIDATRAAPYYGFITLPYVRILITNIDTITNTVFEFCTKLTSTSPPANQIDPAPVIIIGTVQVQDLPLENIAGVLATKPVGAMVINDWYRVASPGDTSGAVWAEIGAYIVPGESAPRVGALFQCIYVIGDFSPTAGKVWDVQYNSWEEDNLVVSAGDLQVVEKNSGDILTAVNSIDSKIVTCDTAAVVVSSGNITETNSTAIAASVASIDGKIVTCDTGAVVVASGNITVDNFPATQPISGSVSITGALPEGTNSIGYIRATAYNVGVDSWQGIQIDAGNTKVVEANSADILTAVNSIDSKIISCDTGAVVVASGSVTISGTAQVEDLPLENIAGVNAPRPVYNMVVGNWYRVANPGNTSGAVWIQIGAPLFNGATLPDIGVLFQCLYLYLNYSTTGTVWDVPYNTDAVIIASGRITETNSAAIAASVASIDSKIISCDTGSVTISAPLPAGTNTLGAVNLRAYSNIIPDFLQLNSVPNGDMNDCLCVSDLAATNIEINANKTSYVENIAGNLFAAGNSFIVYMLTADNRIFTIG